jgi:hypothetical protein
MNIFEDFIKFFITKTKKKPKPIIGGKTIKEIIKHEVDKKQENIEIEYEKEIGEK